MDFKIALTVTLLFCALAYWGAIYSTERAQVEIACIEKRGEMRNDVCTFEK